MRQNQLTCTQEDLKIYYSNHYDRKKMQNLSWTIADHTYGINLLPKMTIRSCSNKHVQNTIEEDYLCICLYIKRFLTLIPYSLKIGEFDSRQMSLLMFVWYAVPLTMRHHLFHEFWLVDTWFFAFWRHHRAVTRLGNGKRLHIAMGIAYEI